MTSSYMTPLEAESLLNSMNIGRDLWIFMLNQYPNDPNGLHHTIALITIALGSENQDFIDVYRSVGGELKNQSRED